MLNNTGIVSFLEYSVEWLVDWYAYLVATQVSVYMYVATLYNSLLHSQDNFIINLTPL